LTYIWLIIGIYEDNSNGILISNRLWYKGQTKINRQSYFTEVGAFLYLFSALLVYFFKHLKYIW